MFSCFHNHNKLQQHYPKDEFGKFQFMRKKKSQLGSKIIAKIEFPYNPHRQTTHFLCVQQTPPGAHHCLRTRPVGSDPWQL